MTEKLIIGGLAMALTVIGYVPYFRDIFKRKTKPHLYTWLIWAITQGTATAALLYGGGNFGSLAFIAGTIMVIIIFFLSFRYGTKNITKSDTAVLLAALLAIVVWWKLNDPVLAVLMVSAIDGLGYMPTFRKTFQDPESETIFFWATMALAAGLSIAANGEYNLLTVLYPATLVVANTTMVLICLLRKNKVKATTV